MSIIFLKSLDILQRLKYNQLKLDNTQSEKGEASLDLKSIRIAKKVTMKEVSASVDITESYYSLIENKKRNPSVEVAKKLGKYFDIEWTLFFESEPESA